MVDISKISNGTTTYDIKDAEARNNINNLANVAKTGDYNDLTNKPTIPTVDQTYSRKSANAQSGVAVASAISSAIASVYKPAGSSAFANLPPLSAGMGGFVFNITDAFTTTSDFVEGAGKEYPAGTNIVCISTRDGYKWDILSGFVDLSGYQTLIDSSHKLNSDLVDDTNTTNKFVTTSDKENWNAKQDAISDLATIRAGAIAGATAVQPSSLASVATSGSYNDLSNKPDLSVYALDNAVVHLSGNETINGAKTFSNDTIFGNYITKYVYERNSNQKDDGIYLKSTFSATSAGLHSTYSGLFFCDSNDLVLCGLAGVISNQYSVASLFANSSNGQYVSEIQVQVDNTGTTTATAPEPTDTISDTSKHIATCGWVNKTGNNVVHLTDNETISGDKLFIGQAQFAAGVGIGFKTSADDEYYVMRSSGAPSSGCGLFLNNNPSTAAFNVTTNKITIGSSTILPNSITPATSDSSTRIATTSYVKSNLSNYVRLEGDETIAGNKTFSGTILKPIASTGNISPIKYLWSNAKGTTISNECSINSICLYDNTGTASNSHRLAQLNFLISSGNTTSTRIMAYKNEVDSTSTAYIGAYYPNTGDAYTTTNTLFRPSTDNSFTLGTSSYRWKQLYAGTSTISTSDERKKQQIEEIPEQVLLAWSEVNFYQFKYNDSVTEKGESARLHTGLIAQRIKTVFESHNLNAFDYGLLCYDEWEAQEEEKDEEENIISPAREAGNLYSLRYEECLCMEAAYQRYRANKLEQRLQNIENLLNISNQG